MFFKNVLLPGTTYIAVMFVSTMAIEEERSFKFFVADIAHIINARKVHFHVSNYMSFYKNIIEQFIEELIRFTHTDSF